MKARHASLVLLVASLAAACAAGGAPPGGGAPAAAPLPLPSPMPAAPALAPGVVPATENPRVREITAAVSAARIERDIRTLAAFGTRHTLSDTLSATRGIGAARRWIFAEFQRISDACGGCLEVRYVSGDIRAAPNSRYDRDTRVVNVVAILRGRTDPGRYVMLTGDIDSRVTDVMDATSDSPGANDNASGIAATLEAARVLSRYPSDASIVFAAISGEEQGLNGGEILAGVAKAEGWNLAAVINNDMIGNTRGITGVTDNTVARVFAPGLHPATTQRELSAILSTGGELDTPARQLARYIQRTAAQYFANLRVEMIYRLDRYGRGGHHTPFFIAGFPASVRLMEAHENYTRQHQDLRVENGIAYGDVVEGVDFDYAAKITALDAATLASLAWAPPAPDSVTIAGAVQPSTTLRWRRVASPDLLGYRIYWRRPEEPTWTRSRWVGDVSEHTLENVIIDNYFFGVAAVDREGNESLTVFPR